MPRFFLLASLLVAAGLGAACGTSDSAPVVASVDVELGRTRAPLGSPIDMHYAFDVRPGVTVPEGYRVMVHVLDAEGREFWNDDHDPPMPTGEWSAETPIRYTRTVFIPLYPYVGQATVRVGLYRDTERLRLEGPVAEENELPAREYTVGALELLPQTENILLVRGSGWHNVEFSPDDPSREWEWTERVATLTFQNPRSDVTFYLESDARPGAFEQPQQVTVRAGTEVVSQFVADQAVPVLRQINIPASALGTGDRAEIQIEVDRTFVPAQQPNGSGDTRVLGIRVYHAFVEVR